MTLVTKIVAMIVTTRDFPTPVTLLTKRHFFMADLKVSQLEQMSRDALESFLERNPGCNELGLHVKSHIEIM
jgi:hypothetical protein